MTMKKISDIMSPVCWNCEYFEGKRKQGSPVCEAFPDGIPHEIWTGQNPHRSEVQGDHGIQYRRRV